MAQEIQPLVYHSLSRHIQSLPIQSEHLKLFNIYSSNQQPPVPSILQRSRTKKSNEKSTKKGLSRVSKSKTTINIGQGLRNQDRERSLSKGTLLNFNIQEVVENKYHLTKPRDELMQISPRKGQIPSNRQTQANWQGSNQKSFINQYRIVTYVPSGRVYDQKGQNLIQQEKQVTRNQSGVQENWDKENNSNHSNVFRHNHHKNDSQSIQIVLDSQDNRFKENTWKTSEKFEPYHYNNQNKLGSEINSTNQQLKLTQIQQGVFPLKQKIQVPVNNDINELKNFIIENVNLKEKIKHLEHQIVHAEREVNHLIKTNNQKDNQIIIVRQQNQKLRCQNLTLKDQNDYLTRQNASYLNNSQTLNKHNKHILTLEKKISQLQSHSDNPKPIFQSYLYEENNRKIQFNQSKLESSLKKQLQSLQQVNNTLELTNAKLSKQLSEKSLFITQINRKNKDLIQKITQIEKQLTKNNEKIQSQQQKLYRKDQKINSLSLEVDRLNLMIKDSKEKHSKPQTNVKNHPPEPQQFNSLQLDRSRQQSTENLLREELKSIRQLHEQLERDYAHLSKKNLFMKDELQHLKYLQANTSSALGHISTTQNQYNSLNLNNQTNLYSKTTLEKQLRQTIFELETRLQITERNLSQVQEEYSNLKLNFRSLEELYMEQKNDNQDYQKNIDKLNQQNNKLKIQLSNLQQISKARTIAASENQSLKLMEKQEELLLLKKSFSNLQRQYNQLQKKFIDHQRILNQSERKFSQTQRKSSDSSTQLSKLQTQLKTLIKQRDDFYNKYMNQLEKNTQLTKRHNEDLEIYMKKMETEQKQKISIVADKYQVLVAKLNEQIQIRKNELFTIKEFHLNQLKNTQQKLLNELRLSQQAHLRELTHNQDEHKKEIQTLLAEIDRQQLRYKTEINKMGSQTGKCIKCKQYEIRIQKQGNQLVQSTNQPKNLISEPNKYQTSSKISRLFCYQTMSRKQLESFTTELQSDLTLIENKYKTILIEKQGLEDHLQSLSRQLTHLERQIALSKEQKEKYLKEKYQLSQQVQKTNFLMLQTKKTAKIFQEQKISFTTKIQELTQKYLATLEDYEKVSAELKQVKKIIYQREASLENYQHDVRQLKISLLQEKQIIQKKDREICSLKEEKETLKSKQEYYKMLFEKTQRQLENQLREKTILLANHAPKESNSSAIKRQSPQKNTLATQNHEVSSKKRQTQLYRIEIFKDLNKLLNMKNQHFTLEQILQKNQQQYLRKLYNAIKQDHDKIISLQKLILNMEDGFKKEKVFIKEDYDVLYEKYLKYKNMCQDMNRDIQGYKLKLKQTKDKAFISLNV